MERRSDTENAGLKRGDAMTFTLSQACGILVLGMFLGCLIGVVAMACCYVSSRENRRDDPLAGLNLNDRLWCNG